MEQPARLVSMDDTVYFLFVCFIQTLANLLPVDNSFRNRRFLAYQGHMKFALADYISHRCGHISPSDLVFQHGYGHGTVDSDLVSED